MIYDHTISDLPQSECVAIIKNRPIEAQVLFILIGIPLLFVGGAMILIGVFILGLGLLSFILTKEYITCKVYKDAVVLCNPNNIDEFKVLPFKDIVSYEIDPRMQSFVIFTVKDNDEYMYYTVHSFKSSLLRKKLYKLIPEKDKIEIRLSNFQNNKKQKSK